MKILFCDTETNGLSPFKHHITLFQYMWEGDTKVKMIRNPTQAQMHAIFDEADRIVMHNAPFDFGMAHYVPDPKKIVDTARLSRLIDYTHEEHSLDLVATRTYGFDPYKPFDKKKMQRTDWSADTLTPEQLRYAELDVKVLKPILSRLERGLSHPIYKFDSLSTSAGLAMQQNGLPVLHDEVEAEIAQTQDALAEALSKLPVNPNSPKQVCAALNIESSADKALAELEMNGHSLAKAIREARRMGKYLNFLNKLNAFERYYGTLGPNANSGRFTSSQNNIQQIPRAQKKFIGSHTNVVISADYAQLELRCIATLARDKTMVHLFRDGEDLHAYTAEQLFGADYTQEQRQIAKVFNFSLLYGAGARTVQQMLVAQAGVHLPEFEVQQLKYKWLNAYKGIAQWQRQGAARYEQSLPNKTPLGRPYMARSYTQMLSLENQGYGAEVARWALHYIMERIKPLGGTPINFVHDSILIECPNDPLVYEPIALLVQEAFKKSWENAPINTYGVPMPVEVGVAHNWKDADSLENCVYVLEDS